MLNNRTPLLSTHLLADTGCTSHFLTEHAHLPQQPAPPLHVKLPNGEIMTSAGTMQLPIPSTLESAQKAHIFPALTSANLLSIGQLCDDKCTATFTKEQLKITKNNNIILEGKRNNRNGM